MQAERNGLHADVFPFLTEVCNDVGLQFEPSDMVRGRLIPRDWWADLRCCDVCPLSLEHVTALEPSFHPPFSPHHWGINTRPCI